MLNHKSLKAAFRIFLAIAPLVIAIPYAKAHTVLEMPTILEGKKVTNNIDIGHGCGEFPVIGTSAVIPDGIDSTITTNTTDTGGKDLFSGDISSFFTNWGNNFRLLQNRSIFSEQKEKTLTSNVVGFWSGGGQGVAPDLDAYVPFIINPLFIEPNSCAKKVQLAIAIADVCRITPLSGINDHTAVNLWTPAVGSQYDGIQGSDHSGYDSPAYLNIERDLVNNPLPETCGEGLFVYVKPSSAQVDRDMPIIFNGTQVWPQP